MYFYLVDGEDQTSKKLKAICGGNSYQEVKYINQIMALCNNNGSTLYEGLGEIYHDIGRFSLEGSKNKQNCHEDDGAGPL